MKLVTLVFLAIAAVAVNGFLSPLPHSFVPSKRNSEYRILTSSPLFVADPAMYVDPPEGTDKHLSDSMDDPPVYAEVETLEEMKVKDPIGVLVNEIKALDINTVINTSVLVCVVLAALTKLTTVDSGFMRGWTVEEMAYRIPLDNWQSYSTILQQAPISTKAVTSATVYTIGDVISQTTEGIEIGELDRPRILRSLLAGLIGHGPLSHLWYDWSEGIFNDVLHWTEWWSFFPKVIVDQATWGPFWNNTYILLLGLMKFDNLDTIWSEMKRTTVPLIVSGLKLWPLAHCVTYGLVPVENRLLWVDMVEIVWVTILATAASGAAEEVAVEEEIIAEEAS